MGRTLAGTGDGGPGSVADLSGELAVVGVHRAVRLMSLPPPPGTGVARSSLPGRTLPTSKKGRTPVKTGPSWLVSLAGGAACQEDEAAGGQQQPGDEGEDRAAGGGEGGLAGCLLCLPRRIGDPGRNLTVGLVH